MQFEIDRAKEVVGIRVVRIEGGRLLEILQRLRILRINAVKMPRAYQMCGSFGSCAAAFSRASLLPASFAGR